MSTDADISSWSSVGGFTWGSTEEVANLFNTSVDEFTPEKIKQVYNYSNVWNNTHGYAN